MTMERNLNERKRGIRDVCKEDGRGFGTIVILLLCHSDFISLLQIPQTLPLILLATFFTQKKIYIFDWFYLNLSFYYFLSVFLRIINSLLQQISF